MRSPTIEIKICPECGNEIELFSNEFSTSCTRCGFKVHNDKQTCVKWCRYAKDCVGETLYNELMGKNDDS